ncbi:hypothetical protein K438DRAFT_1814761 [Mycena galopus ATCC 62051]|nr:hypothetical protein K438DRAFT_1814761 [Mycena galopus ATCC 62051]
MILCYDYLLTLRSEIHFVWGKPKRLSSFLFGFLRHGCLLSNIGMIGLRFGPVPLDVWIILWCHAMFLTNIVLLILQNVLVRNILGLRSMSCTISASWCFCFSSWSISGEIWVATQTSDCEFSLPKGSAIRKSTGPEPPLHLKLRSLKGMAGAWVAQLGCDVVVFVFTVIRSYNQPSKIRRSILSYMLRDVKEHIISLSILALVNLGNILIPSWFKSTLSVTMVSRLMLHLHQVADLGVLTQHDEETSVHFRPGDEESGICTQD